MGKWLKNLMTGEAFYDTLHCRKGKFFGVSGETRTTEFPNQSPVVLKDILEELQANVTLWSDSKKSLLDRPLNPIDTVDSPPTLIQDPHQFANDLSTTLPTTKKRSLALRRP